VDFQQPLRRAIGQGAYRLGLAEAKKLGPVFAWGNFITILINFLILAFCIFLVIKGMNTMKKRMEQPVPPRRPR